MGRRQGSHHTRRALTALLALALLAGCANSAWYAASPSQGSVPSSGPPPTGGSVRAAGVNPSGAWLGFGILLGMVYGSYYSAEPYMDPNRRVVEHDCSKPIEDWTANLRCR